MKLSVEENDYKFCPNCKTKLQRKQIDGVERFFCPSCDFIFWNNPKPVVSILLHKEDKILMLQRANKPLKNYWCLPGGFLNYGETAEEAIKREANEEIGGDVEIKGLIGVYLIDNDPRGIHIDIIFYGSCTDTIKLSKEDKNWKYFKKDGLPDKIAYKHRQAIEAWLKKENNQ